MKTIFYISTIITTLLFVACSNKSEVGHTHEHDGHNDHGHETGTLSYTLFSDDYELFVEFPALAVGQTSSFAAHFTKLSSYKPVSEGQLTVSIEQGGKAIRHTVDAPSSPGIFRAALQPKEAGTYQLTFELESPSGNARFVIPDTEVYAHMDEAVHAIEEEENVDAINYSKEQAWKTDFATQEIMPKAFYSVIHTSAKVKGQSQSMVTLNALASGQVNLISVIGQSVKKGEILAAIASAGLENNLNMKLKESKIAFEKSKEDYKRTKPLVDRQAISQKDFLETESKYRQDSLRYYQLAEQVSDQGLSIRAPIDGYVSNINVNNGQFVEVGSPVMAVSGQNHILIEAYVNQSDFQKVGGIFDANFSFTGNKETISLDGISGKIASKNAFVIENSTRIPVTFSAQNNGKLMPGMFLEAFLKTGRKDNALVIPISAVIEEQGQYFVFVQTGGKSFVKREVKLANNDGIHTEITSGLSEGERIVTAGAYQIKLAAMAGDLPLHGHTH
jgi:membrane fusion protein, heavy metal efflux system